MATYLAGRYPQLTKNYPLKTDKIITGTLCTPHYGPHGVQKVLGSIRWSPTLPQTRWKRRSPPLRRRCQAAAVHGQRRARWWWWWWWWWGAAPTTDVARPHPRRTASPDQCGRALRHATNYRPQALGEFKYSDAPPAGEKQSRKGGKQRSRLSEVALRGSRTHPAPQTRNAAGSSEPVPSPGDCRMCPARCSRSQTSGDRRA